MPEDVSSPHDRFFRELLSRPEVAADIARQTLPPDVVELLDLSHPERVDDKWVDPELQSHFADVLYKVRFAEGPHEALLFILFEHKSHPDELVALQVLRYMLQVWQQHLKESQLPLPVVIPLVMYHGRRDWSVSREFTTLFDVANAKLYRFIPQFEYALLDLSANSTVVPTGSDLVRVALEVMQSIFRDDFKEKLPDQLSKLPLGTSTQIQFLETVLLYAKSARSLSEAELGETVRQAFPREGEQSVIKLFDDLRQEGRQEGLEEGLLEAVVVGLEQKFGAAGKKLGVKIRAVHDVEKLRVLMSTLWSAEKLDDLRQLLK